MRLHPLSIPYRIAETALGLIWVVLVAAFALSSGVGGALAVVLFGLLVLGGLAAIVGWEIAYHRRFEYELTDSTLDIASGVLSRREREIPYGRIQNVSINRNVFQRVLGLAEVRIETAGGGTTEAHLRFVGGDEADRLQDELSERKRREPAEIEPGEATERPARESDHLLFEITSRELGVLGVVSLDARFLVLVLFALSPFLPQLGEFFSGTTALLLVVPIAVVALYLVSAIVSAAYSVTNYYGFRLVRSGDELRYERGLLQRFSGTIPLEKVQAVTISENLLARAFGYASLLVETAGYSPGETGGSQSAIPIARRERVLHLARDIEPFDFPEFERPPKRARERYAVRYLGVLAIVAGLTYAVTWGFDSSVQWYWVLVALPLVPIAAHLKWLHRGYALTDGYVLTRNGFWRRTIKIVPYHRVQTVIDSRSIFQRRRRLATLTIDTAGSQSLVSDDSKAVDIDDEIAAELRETIADRLLESIGERRKRGRRPTIDSIRDPDATAHDDRTRERDDEGSLDDTPRVADESATSGSDEPSNGPDTAAENTSNELPTDPESDTQPERDESRTP